MLRLNYKDDILDEEVNTERKYEITQSADGFSRIADKTSYKQNGNEIGASEMKEIVRSLYDFKNATVVFNSDGSISEQLDIGTKDTVFNADGSISETITDNEANKITKNTVFNADGSITSSVGNVVIV